MVNKSRIYQIYCGRWESANVIDHPGKVLERLSQFDWSRLAKQQINAIYLLGLWDVTGPIVVNTEAGRDLTNVPHRYPSAFAIVDHTKVNPDLGDEANLVKLIEIIHSFGMQVYVDLVANHTGLAHPWVKAKPEFYKPGHAFSGDVLELNYDNPEVWLAMMQTTKTLVSYGVDGFRCDMAHLVYPQFWQQLIRMVKTYKPEFKFIAEAYGKDIFDQHPRNQLLEAGFDSIYDGGLHQNLRQLAQGNPLADLVGHLNFVMSQAKNKWTHYLSNHDDPFPLPPELLGPSLCLLQLLDGNLFYFNGVLGGYTKRLAHHSVELLPDRYVLETKYPNLNEWMTFADQFSLKIDEFRSENNAYIKAKWRTDTENGVLLFNFSRQTHMDEPSETRLEPYQSLIVRTKT